MIEATGAVFEAKFMLPWSFSGPHPHGVGADTRLVEPETDRHIAEEWIRPRRFRVLRHGGVFRLG
jgi:hypothetical protein